MRESSLAPSNLQWSPYFNTFLEIKDFTFSDPNPPITIGSFDCNFDNGYCGWLNDSTAEFYWYRTTNETPSKDTGPPWDHTQAGGRCKNLTIISYSIYRNQLNTLAAISVITCYGRPLGEGGETYQRTRIHQTIYSMNDFTRMPYGTCIRLEIGCQRFRE